ncbi:FixH family protein [Solitalea lacus]|nr:FixH family protein [Solitalea lacus]
MAYRAMRENFELISPNYYADELKYQEKINASENAGTLSESLKVEAINKSITIDLPKDFEGKSISGEINLVRPSDKSKDVKVPLNASMKGVQQISSNKFVKGLYLLQIQVKCDGKDYFFEQNIFMQ